MKLSLRFIVPLILVLAVLASAAMPLVDRLTFRWFVKDLDLRANLIANTVEEPVRQLVAANDRAGLRALFSRITQDERLYAVGVCAGSTDRPEGTATMPLNVRCDSLAAYRAPSGHVVTDLHGPLLISARTLRMAPDMPGALVLVQDMSFAARRSEETKRYLFYFFIGLGAVISVVTVVVAQLSWRGWVQGMRALMRGEGLLRPTSRSTRSELQPIADDLRTLIRDLESEHRLRDDERLSWTPETLREILDRELRGAEVIVVSNREPFIHVREDGDITIQRPASGLVTAVEPIMRACSGTWIAHGSGSADRDAVDANDRVDAPVEEPGYKLRRLWLTKDEEAGYYYGFSNEGLWPLCHIAHVRPTFRTSDWSAYEQVNRKFADAVVEEARSTDPIVLVQDYHLALVPRMIREQLPDATIITFWHIPWPNPEAFAICPQREELLDGLLGSSILGFHTQFHCNNFVDTVDRQLEARVDRETFGVSYRGERTLVKRYPISVESPPAEAVLAHPVDVCRGLVRSQLDLPADQAIGVGVDRLDYTKGLEERFRAVERLLEQYPEWIGRFTFVQIAAPTRSRIEQYQSYEHRVRELAGGINARFANRRAPAIILLAQHHDAHQVFEYYRSAELCFVSSLHDGMNLVAKEFVAARDDEAGVLLLSQFTGAARELPEALIVNPYDAEQCAAALDAALTMPLRMQRARMRLMRGLIHEFNVYRWAGRMLLDAATVRRRGRFANRPLWPIKRTRVSDGASSSSSSAARGSAIGRQL
ncbi:MAG TPA: trehalose-6-phosphate synthase [Gemmatimonadaceae bacterium]|nr:trehalose-6-phosphate synthase [Gemmatimonadaceae bacterium]